MKDNRSNGKIIVLLLSFIFVDVFLMGVQKGERMSLKSIKTFYLKNKAFVTLSGIILLSLLLFGVLRLFQPAYEKVITENIYLTWHSLIEITSILVSFAVFISTYYTYSQNRNLRLVLIGVVFLSMGVVDLFHTLSFKGMHPFFSNVITCCTNTATTFWVFARLIGSLGIAVASLIPPDKESKLNKMFFSVPAMLLSVAILIIVVSFQHLLPPMFIEGAGLTRTKVVLEYLVAGLFTFSIIKLLDEYNKEKDYLLILFSGGLVLNIFSEVAFISYTDPYDIYNFIGHIYKVVASYLIFRSIFISSVQKPYIQLSETRNELKTYAENLDKVVYQRTKQLKEMNQKLLDDLEYARDIQLSLLPSEVPSTKGVNFAVRYFTAERVSGDYYNIFYLDDEHIGLYIGDVSGHGVSAAMLTVFVKQAIRAKTELNDKEATKNPALMLKELYRSFNDTNFKDEVYIVMLYAVYNVKKRTLTYASAGLNVLPLLSKQGAAVEKIKIEGFPICKFLEFYPAEYENYTLQLDVGDKMLIYTDGLIETRNKKGCEYSESRLIKTFQNTCGLSAQLTADRIVKSVFDYSENAFLTDDITLLIIEVG